MAARSSLENPAFYSGFESTPKECIEAWVRISLETGNQFTYFHHHLSYMLEKLLPRPERKYFNSLNSTLAVLDFLRDHFQIELNS